MVEGKTLLVIHVSKGIRPIYCQKKYGFSSGGCSIRIETTCREMTQEQIRIRYEQNFIGSDLMLKTPAKYSRIHLRRHGAEDRRDETYRGESDKKTSGKTHNNPIRIKKTGHRIVIK